MKTRYFLLLLLLVIPIAIFAQDSTAVNEAAKYFPGWLITVMTFVAASFGGSGLSIWLSKKVTDPKVKFLMTWTILILLGAMAAKLSGINITEYDKFISFVVNAATAGYVLLFKKR